MKKKLWKITAFFMAVALTVTCFNLENLYVHATGTDETPSETTYVKGHGVKNEEGASVSYIQNARPETLEEGQVWTGKKVTDNGDGTFTITFEAIGRKYQDNRNGGVWNDPLKEGSYLTITEDIANGFEIVENSLTDGNLTVSDGTVTWKLPADKVTSDNDGNITDNKVSFKVKCIGTEVGTYKTNLSNVKFTPDGYNHYYYEWETVKGSTGGILNWNGSGSNGINAVTLNNIVIGGKTYSGVQAHATSGGITEKRVDRNGVEHEYIKRTASNNLTNLEGSGVDHVDIYNYFGELDPVNAEYKAYDIIVEFKDSFGNVLSTYRVKNDDETVKVPQKGGNKLHFDFNEVIIHTEPVLKEKFGTNKELNFDLNNYGWLEIAEKPDIFKAVKTLDDTTQKEDNTWWIKFSLGKNIEIDFHQDVVATNVTITDEVADARFKYVDDLVVQYKKSNENDSQWKELGQYKDGLNDYYKISTSKGDGEGGKLEFHFAEVTKDGIDVRFQEKANYGVYSSDNANAQHPDLETNDNAYVDYTSINGVQKQIELESPKVYIPNPKNYIELDKTATQGEDARHFTINLKASSNYKLEIKPDPMDIILILDSSSSMKDKDDSSELNRIQMLNKSVRNFIDIIKRNSPDSRIAIIEFSKNAKDLTNGFQPIMNYNFNDLKIDKNNTNMSEALKIVYENYYHSSELDRKPNQSHKQLLVTFTDGENNYSKDSNDADIKIPDYFPTIDFYHYNKDDIPAMRYALQIKQEGVINYAIGLGNNGPFQRDFFKTVASGDSAPYYTNPKNTNELEKVFDGLAHTLIKEESLQNVTITDTLTKEFKLSEEEKNRLSKEATIVENSDGTTTITWENQTVYYSEDENNPGWHKQINVIAKDDFLGGNFVPTNVNATLEYETITKEFPKPTVNVGPLPINLEDKDIVVFKGDEINVESYASELYNSIKFNNSLSVTNGAFSSIQLTDNEIRNLVANGTLTKDSYEYSNDGKFGKVIYTLTPKNVTNHTATQESAVDGETGNKLPVETYTLNVQYIPMTVEERKNYLGDKAKSFREPTNSIQTGSQGDGNYKVYVVAGEIDLTKYINQQYTNTAIVNANQSFVFKISKYDSEDATTPNDVFYQTISFSANQSILNKTVKIKDLEKGYYTIEEVSNWSWKYDKTLDESNYAVNGNENEKIFIGDKLTDNKFFGVESETMINGVDYSNVATSDFRNVKNSKNIVSDVASAINKFNKYD